MFSKILSNLISFCSKISQAFTGIFSKTLTELYTKIS